MVDRSLHGLCVSLPNSAFDKTKYAHSVAEDRAMFIVKLPQCHVPCSLLTLPQ